MRVRFILGAVVVAAGVLVPAAHAATPLLPDLAERPPSAVGVEAVDTGAGLAFHLGFDSAAQNVGTGPAEIQAHRTGPPGADMPADQLIHYSDGTTAEVPVGVLHYDTDPSHDHWHYQGFERYELRRLGDDSLVAPDSKVGFCLADVYKAPDFAGSAAARTFTDWCGEGDPSAASIDEGISVGWGDVYGAQVDGQYIDITGVPTGYYQLVNRVNPDGKLLETDPSNDAASALVSIEWSHGSASSPDVAEMRACPHSATCPGDAPPVAATGSASQIAASAATISGSVDARGLPAAAHFEYGPTASYGRSTPPVALDASSLAAPAASTLTGLAPGAVYHYRLVVASSAGASVGADELFRTADAGAPTMRSTRTVRVVSALVRGDGTVVVRVTTTGAGRLAASLRLGRALVSARRAVAKGGTWPLTLRPTRAQRARLARAARLAVSVKFTPRRGRVVQLRARVTRPPRRRLAAMLGL